MKQIFQSKYPFKLQFIIADNVPIMYFHFFPFFQSQVISSRNCRRLFCIPDRFYSDLVIRTNINIDLIFCRKTGQIIKQLHLKQCLILIQKIRYSYLSGIMMQIWFFGIHSHIVIGKSQNFSILLSVKIIAVIQIGKQISKPFLLINSSRFIFIFPDKKQLTVIFFRRINPVKNLSFQHNFPDSFQQF